MPCPYILKKPGNPGFMVLIVLRYSTLNTSSSNPMALSILFAFS